MTFGLMLPIPHSVWSNMPSSQSLERRHKVVVREISVCVQLLYERVLLLGRKSLPQTALDSHIYLKAFCIIKLGSA